jgi:thiamine transporter
MNEHSAPSPEVSANPSARRPTSLRERLGMMPGQWMSAWGVIGMVEIALAVSLAAGLGMVKLFIMPQGGSVSLEMIPILFIAVRRGVLPAMVAGFLYGLVQIMLPGFYYVHPLQLVLDYPLAFAAIGLAGLIPVPWFGAEDEQPRWTSSYTGLLVVAVTLGVLGRFVCHFVSGIVYFGSYAPQGQPVWLYSLLYNGSYLLPELAISVVALWALVPACDRALGSVRSAGGWAGGR